ncbi:MAG: lysophospholipid acyltransferase family protein [Eubacteriales bacterium]|nr:lysophospholipid acyltransferase family protein [Eubacteriales bacterium]
MSGQTEFSPGGLPYRLVRGVIFCLFPPLFGLLYGWRVRGGLEKSAAAEGCVTVCNHAHTLDCVMLACAFRKHVMQFLTLEENLRLPVAGPLVRLLGGIGLPEGLSGWRQVCGRIEKAFSEGELVQIYPEGELISGCRTLRAFRPGAFTFAARYHKPVVPCVLRFYPRYGLLGRRRRDGRELVILPPVFPAEKETGRRAARTLEERVRAAMEQALREPWEALETQREVL